MLYLGSSKLHLTNGENFIVQNSPRIRCKPNRLVETDFISVKLVQSSVSAGICTKTLEPSNSFIYDKTMEIDVIHFHLRYAL